MQGLDESEHYAYRCRNGLWDVAFPLVVGGEHVANVYTGQFFFEDDDVDREAFAERARRLGFDVDEYLEALDRVPVITQARLQKTIGFLSDFVGMLGELGLSALQHEQKHALLLESERRYRRLFDNAAEGLIVFRVERGAGGEVEDLVIADVNPIQAQRTKVHGERLVGWRLSEFDGSDERCVPTSTSCPAPSWPGARRAARCTCGRPGPTNCCRRTRWPTTCGWCRRPTSPTCARPSGRCGGRKRVSGWPTSTCWTR